MELRDWRPQGPRLLPTPALSALGDRSTCITWQFFKKRCLLWLSLPPLKNSSAKSRKPRASSSHRGSVLAAVQRVFGVPNIDYPLRNAGFHAIYHEGCYLSLYRQNVHCGWNIIFHPGNNPLFLESLCLVFKTFSRFSHNIKNNSIYDPSLHWGNRHLIQLKSDSFTTSGAPEKESPSTGPRLPWAGPHCHVPACTGTPSRSSLNSCGFPGSLHCVQILICETTDKGWWRKAKIILSFLFVCLF